MESGKIFLEILSGLQGICSRFAMIWTICYIATKIVTKLTGFCNDLSLKILSLVT